jgi:regulator of nucleoside diphosphate kinase
VSLLDVSVIISTADHARLRRIASAGMRIRRAPPSARWLEAELDRARVVSPSNLPKNVISMHSVFDFQDGITDHVRRATLVYPGEEDQGIGRISILSPLGSALIGLAEGQSMQWRGATGEWWTLWVIRVIRHPEARQQGATAQP